MTWIDTLVYWGNICYQYMSNLWEFFSQDLATNDALVDLLPEIAKPVWENLWAGVKGLLGVENLSILSLMCGVGLLWVMVRIAYKWAFDILP